MKNTSINFPLGILLILFAFMLSCSKPEADTPEKNTSINDFDFSQFDTRRSIEKTNTWGTETRESLEFLECCTCDIKIENIDSVNVGGIVNAWPYNDPNCDFHVPFTVQAGGAPYTATGVAQNLFNGFCPGTGTMGNIFQVVATAANPTPQECYSLRITLTCGGNQIIHSFTNNQSLVTGDCSSWGDSYVLAQFIPCCDAEGNATSCKLRRVGKLSYCFFNPIIQNMNCNIANCPS